MLGSMHPKKERPSLSVVHLCAFHMLGIMKYKFRDLKNTQKMKEFGKFPFALMMMSKTLEKGSLIYTHICRASGNKKKVIENATKALII